MIEDPTRPQYVTDDPEPVIAGTLCLMSAFAQQPCPGVAHKVIRNLEVLMRHPACSATLRGYCNELRQRWVNELVGSRSAPSMVPGSVGSTPSVMRAIAPTGTLDPGAPADGAPPAEAPEFLLRSLVSRTLH